jgi:hypothetical protein
MHTLTLHCGTAVVGTLTCKALRPIIPTVFRRFRRYRSLYKLFLATCVSSTKLVPPLAIHLRALNHGDFS